MVAEEFASFGYPLLAAQTADSSLDRAAVSLAGRWTIWPGFAIGYPVFLVVTHFLGSRERAKAVIASACNTKSSRCDA